MMNLLRLASLIGSLFLSYTQASAACSSSQVISLAAAGYNRQQIEALCSTANGSAEAASAVLRTSLASDALYTMLPAELDLTFGDGIRVSVLDARLCDVEGQDELRVIAAASFLGTPAVAERFLSQEDCRRSLSAVSDRVAQGSPKPNFDLQKTFVVEGTISQPNQDLLIKITDVVFPTTTSVSAHERAGATDKLKNQGQPIVRLETLSFPLILGNPTDVKVIKSPIQVFVKLGLGGGLIRIAASLDKRALARSNLLSDAEALLKSPETNVAVSIPNGLSNELAENYLRHVRITVKAPSPVGDIRLDKFVVDRREGGLSVGGSISNSSSSQFDVALTFQSNLILTDVQVTPRPHPCAALGPGEFIQCTLRNAALVELGKLIGAGVLLYGKGKQMVHLENSYDLTLQERKLILRPRILRQELVNDSIVAEGSVELALR